MLPHVLSVPAGKTAATADALRRSGDVWIGRMVLAAAPLLFWRGQFIAARKCPSGAGVRRRLATRARTFGIAPGLFGDGADASRGIGSASCSRTLAGWRTR